MPRAYIMWRRAFGLIFVTRRSSCRSPTYAKTGPTILPPHAGTAETLGHWSLIALERADEATLELAAPDWFPTLWLRRKDMGDATPCA